jgi:hypothetical protein
VSKPELNELVQAFWCGLRDDALTLEPVNAEHLRLTRAFSSSQTAIPWVPLLSWNGKLEKDFMLWSSWLKSYLEKVTLFDIQRLMG